MKFLVSIIAIASTVIMTTASATTIDTQKTVKQAPEVITFTTKSGISEFDTIYNHRKCPPLCA